uniref:Uncharacterized protein n=1 Tax=Arundo donax TaxID=35708 RepID=A0A0A9FF63_ARUDO
MSQRKNLHEELAPTRQEMPPPG